MTVKYVSPNAKALLALICKEHALQCERVAGGHIKADQVQTFLLERLQGIASRNLNLRRFLADVGHIPAIEDDSRDVPWAEEPRDGFEHIVRHETAKSRGIKRNAVLLEDELEHPAPGERVC